MNEICILCTMTCLFTSVGGSEDIVTLPDGLAFITSVSTNLNNHVFTSTVIKTQNHATDANFDLQFSKLNFGARVVGTFAVWTHMPLDVLAA